MNNNVNLYLKLKFYFNRINTHKKSGISYKENHIFDILIFLHKKRK